jgi:cation diffusion facilitator family transporter
MCKMHADTLDRYRHDHGGAVHAARHETRTRWVVVLTCAMMIGELIVGYATNSLALTADGWHMATHAGALSMAAFAYWFARTRAKESAFSFGTGKVHALAGYTSAVVLAMVALWMLGESASRLLHPMTIHFREALPVAAIGLLVNLASAALLHPGGEHHDHDHSDHRHDHNLRAAYVHVLADALTSVLAISALVGGRYFGWNFLDPMMGVVGGVVILRWAYSLCADAARQLLDMVPSAKLVDAIRARLESVDDVRVADLHLWDAGPNQRSCIVSLVTSQPRAPDEYARLVEETGGARHVTVEVHTCDHVHRKASGDA